LARRDKTQFAWNSIMWYVLEKIKEFIMPMGKGTYGSKVGRPPKKTTKKKKTKKSKKGKK